jgi:putative transposase
MIQQFTYKYRLYPNKEQMILLSKCFGHTRFLFNEFLRNRIDAYKEIKITLNYYDNQNSIPPLKKEYSWLKEVSSQSLQYSARRLQNAFDHFFRKIKLKKQGKLKGKCGFPKFKRKHDKQSFHVPQNINIIDDKLTFPKFKIGIPINLHRPLEGDICFATISKNKANQYYASITVEQNIQELPKITKVVGLDLNVKYIVASDEKKYANPLPSTTKYKSRERLFAKAVSRKTDKTSKRRQKAKLKLNKLKLKEHNIREDFLHKISKKLIDENQVIVLEDLSVMSMLKNKKEKRNQPRWKEKSLHRGLNDCCFSSFVQKLTYKAKWYGRQIIKVDRYFPSSQLCNICGWQNKDLGEEKEWICWECFAPHDRDENSSKNIVKEGLRLINLGNPGDSQASSSVRLTTLVSN